MGGAVRLALVGCYFADHASRSSRALSLSLHIEPARHPASAALLIFQGLLDADGLCRALAVRGELEFSLVSCRLRCAGEDPRSGRIALQGEARLDPASPLFSLSRIVGQIERPLTDPHLAELRLDYRKDLAKIRCLLSSVAFGSEKKRRSMR